MVTSRNFAPWCSLLVLAAVGCAAPEAPFPAGPAAPTVSAQQVASDAAEAPPTCEQATRVTVETSVSLERLALDDATAKVRDAVKSAHGYVAEARRSGDDDARNAWFEVRIPLGEPLDSFRSAIADLGVVTSETEKTEQLADGKACLGKARAGDIVLDDGAPSGLETSALAKAQEREPAGQVASATVKIDLSVRYTAGTLKPWPRIRRAWVDGIRAASALLVGLLVVVETTGPTLLVALGFGWGFTRGARLLARRISAWSRVWTTRRALYGVFQTRRIELSVDQEALIDASSDIATLRRWRRQAERAMTAAEALQ